MAQEKTQVASSAPPPPEASGAEVAFGQVAQYYDHLMRNVPYRFWLTYVQSLLDRFRLRPKRVLDLACGTGTMAFLMEEAGYEVVGADVAPAMLQRAQEKAEHRGSAARFVLQDASCLSFRDEFDAAISLFDSLNYVRGEDRLCAVFRGVRQALRSGGLFVFDINTLRALRLNLFSQEHFTPRDWLHYRWVSHWDEEEQLCTIDMEFWVKKSQGAEEHFRETHYQTAYPLHQIEKMLAEAGLEPVGSFDAYRTLPPHQLSTRIFLVARRPE